MHAPPVRGGITSYLLSRGARILLVVLFLFVVVSLVPFHTEQGEQWKISHYVYKPQPAKPLGWTEEGWKKGHGRWEGASGGQDSKEQGKQDAIKVKEEDIGKVEVHKDSEDKSPEQAHTGGLGFDTGTVGGAAPIEESKAQKEGDKTVAVKGVPIKHESNEYSPYAYVFYATEDAYACSVLVNIDRLQTGFKTKHRIFVLATRDLSKAYLDAFRARGVTVTLQRAPKMPSGSAQYYINCMTKLLAFKLHHIDKTLRRILVIDSDQLILQNLDHLFTGLPPVDLAAPRAYWIQGGTTLSSTFMMITLSERLWSKVDDATKHIGENKYDMDIINDLFNDTALVLPGRFVTINSHWEAWDLPRWWHPEEDWSGIEIEQPMAIDANAEIHGEKVDEVSSHAGHNFHPPPENAGRHWRRFEKMPAEDAKEGVFPKPVLRRPQSGTETGEKEEMEEVEVSTVVEKPTVPTKEERPLYKELHQLYPEAAVLHFFALGKPWQWNLQSVVATRPNAHPVFYQQFKEWRTAAMQSCPYGLIREV
ncbi:Hypothetical protein D9617_9g024620 [Elsinoe fawcettii]|nr:Hypothetical protein D9617_9g024620 [Elsinoe fawcettii]